MSRISDKTFSQKRHRNGQQVREKMFNITNPQGNADQNHNEVPPHSGQNGRHPKVYKHQMLERVWRKGNPRALLMGM